MTAILGISAFYHDAAAALVVDGRILAAAQEERFSRRKHDERLPVHAIEYCLQEAGLQPGQLDFVGFYEKPLLKFDRLLETYCAYAPRGFRSFARAMPPWLKQKLHLPRELRRGLGKAYRKRFVFTEHHESHAASAFFPSPFEEAAILTIDGAGEWATATCGHGQGNEIAITQELRFPHSLGLLYSAFTHYCGFRVNSGEYKLMGLAPYGEPKYREAILERLLDLKPDGSFRMNLSYFDYCHGRTMTSRRFHRLFGGPPRRPEGTLDERFMDVAASIQAVTEEIMLRMARHAHEQTGANNLCLAGGVALNCVGNGRILREGPFDDVWIQPAAGDAGGALGVALFIWHQLLGEPRVCQPADAQQGSLLGPRFEEAEIREFLQRHGVVFRELPDDEALCERVAERLAAEQVVGWFHGRMEFGPRALGGRSILADARSREMQSVLNQKIKFRESFRPFAPSVLAERASDFFDMRPEVQSPYMLVVAGVHETKRRGLSAADVRRRGLEKLRVCRSDVPAVTHVDSSARVQTVDAVRHGRYHALLRKFAEKTGCPVLVNTSFNVRGEPIVCTPEEAYRCFAATQMDVLVLERFVVLKEEQPHRRGPVVPPEVPKPTWPRWAGFSKDPSPGELRWFGLLFSAFFALLAALAWATLPSPSASYVLLAAALVAAPVYYAVPAVRRPAYVAWMNVTYPLGLAITLLLLAAAYYFVVTPVALVLRLLGRDALGRRLDPAAESYWMDHRVSTEKDVYFRQF